MEKGRCKRFTEALLFTGGKEKDGMELHAAGEDYLEAVLLLEQEKQMVYSADLARRMGVTRASVSRAVGICATAAFCA